MVVALVAHHMFPTFGLGHRRIRTVRSGLCLVHTTYFLCLDSDIDSVDSEWSLACAYHMLFSFRLEARRIRNGPCLVHTTCFFGAGFQGFGIALCNVVVLDQ